MQEQALALSEFTIILRMADDSIDRHCEVVSDADKCFNIRFDVVVLIFVDGLLTPIASASCRCVVPVFSRSFFRFSSIFNTSTYTE